MIKYIKSLSQLIPGIVALCVLSGCCTSFKDGSFSFCDEEDFSDTIADAIIDISDEAEDHRQKREARKQAEHIRDYERQQSRNKK